MPAALNEVGINNAKLGRMMEGKFWTLAYI